MNVLEDLQARQAFAEQRKDQHWLASPDEILEAYREGMRDFSKVAIPDSNGEFIGKNLEWINFRLADLTNVDFSDCYLVGSDFSHCYMENTHFRRAKLPAVSFMFSYMDTCVFTDSILTDTNFRHCNLYHCNFRDSDLYRADFSYSDLSNALLTTANLAECKFQGSNLDAAHCTGNDRIFTLTVIMSTARHRTIIAYIYKGQVLLWVGCQNGITPDQFRDRVGKVEQTTDRRAAAYKAQAYPWIAQLEQFAIIAL